MNNTDTTGPCGDTSVRVPYAIKYRPKFFDEVIGQDDAIHKIQTMVKKGKPPHLILSGPSGAGKTTIARNLSKLLDCTSGLSLQSCGTCSKCKISDSGSSRAFYEINASGPDGRKEAFSEFMEDNLRYVPPGYRYNVVFVDEAQRLSAHVIDMLLKEMEAESSATIFVFALIDGRKLPYAFQTRFQEIKLRAPTAEHIQQSLTRIANSEALSVDADALQLISARVHDFRDAAARLEEAQYAARIGQRITLDLVRTTLFQAEGEDVVAYFNAALNGDMQAAMAAVRRIAVVEQNGFAIVQRLLLHVKAVMIGPFGNYSERSNELLYDAQDIAALLEPLRRNAVRVHESMPVFFDRLLEHWTFTPPPSREAFEIHADRFVAICAAFASDDGNSPLTLQSIPKMDERYLSSKGRRPRTVRRRLASIPCDNPEYLSAGQAADLYEAGTFLLQQHGVAFNSELSVDFASLGIHEERDGASLLTRLGRELAQIIIRGTAGVQPVKSLHRVSHISRDVEEKLHGYLVLHLPARMSVSAARWTERWFHRHAPTLSGKVISPKLNFLEPVDPRNSVDRHWRLLRGIWGGVDPSLEDEGVPLLDRLGVARPLRRSVGKVAGSRLHTSESIGPSARRAAAAEGMAHISAWREGRWDQLFERWELREHRVREALRAERTDRIAALAERRAATGDPLTLTLIDQLARDERGTWPAHSSSARAEKLWPSAPIL